MTWLEKMIFFLYFWTLFFGPEIPERWHLCSIAMTGLAAAFFLCRKVHPE